jgi:Na+-translocating ferredoxin:NAD+ oxidoreductase subunit A
MNIFAMLLSSMLIQNVVLYRLLGLETLFGYKFTFKQTIVVSGLITLTLSITSILIYPIQVGIIEIYDLGFLSYILYAFVVGLVGFVLYIVIKKVIKTDQTIFLFYVPFVVVSSAVLGIIITQFETTPSFIEALASSIGAGFGYGLVAILFFAIRYRLSAYKIPENLKGLPIELITAGLMALAFLGFSGLF